MLRWILEIRPQSPWLFPWLLLGFLFYLSLHLVPDSIFLLSWTLSPLGSCVRSPLRLPAEVVFLLTNSVSRLKGGNYIHAAWPLWTLSAPLPCLLSGNWLKGPHWHLRDGNGELWKCQRAFANVYVQVCMCKVCVKTAIRSDTLTHHDECAKITLNLNLGTQLNWQHWS